MKDNIKHLEEITTKSLVLSKDLNMIIDLSSENMSEILYEYLEGVSHKLDMISQDLAEELYKIKNS